MKIFLLEPDSELADRIDTSLNQLRLKIDVKKVQHEEDLFHEDPSVLPSYNLFILNLKDPTDACTMKFLRENGSDAPVRSQSQSQYFSNSLLSFLRKCYCQGFFTCRNYL